MPERLSVDIKSSGLRLALILLNRPFKQLEIDFNTLKAVNRDQNYVLSPSHLNFKQILKFETQIKHISPDTLYFSEKTGYQKNVPLKVPLYLKCKEGYSYSVPVITPVFVTIWGDTTIIDKVDTLYTQPFTLNKLSKNVNVNLPVLRPNAGVYTITKEANVFIEVSKLVEQTINLPLNDIQLNRNQLITIFPSVVKVKFTSVQNAFSTEDTSLFKASIDSRKINKFTKKCPVFLNMVPGEVTIMDIEPKEVEILILKK